MTNANSTNPRVTLEANQWEDFLRKKCVKNSLHTELRLGREMSVWFFLKNKWVAAPCAIRALRRKVQQKALPDNRIHRTRLPGRVQSTHLTLVSLLSRAWHNLVFFFFFGPIKLPCLLACFSPWMFQPLNRYLLVQFLDFIYS